MNRTVLGATWALIMGAAAVGAQTPQQKPSTPAQPAAVGQSITMTGCVYQTSDQPTTFALRRMADAPGSAQSGVGTAGAAGASAAGGATTGAAGTATAGASRSDEGAWYRLMGDAKLKEHVGERVRVNGTVTPGKDEKGADVVIHRFQPDKLTVTTIDLAPAPQLRIQTITEMSGECPKATPGAK